MEKHASSKIYVQSKRKACEEIGIHCEVVTIDEGYNLQSALEKDYQNPDLHGVLVQKPTVKGFLDDWIVPEMDVDGFHPINAGHVLLNDKRGVVPCTPKGMMFWLKHLTTFHGQNIAIIGRSSIVGRPFAALCFREKLTVTVLNKHSIDIPSITSQADILVSATGVPGLIKENYVKEGAIVFDVGINRLESGKVVGDVDEASVLPKVKYLTAVPGGVGPMTVTMVLWNVCELAGIDCSDIK